MRIPSANPQAIACVRGGMAMGMSLLFIVIIHVIGKRGAKRNG